MKSIGEAFDAENIKPSEIEAGEDMKRKSSGWVEKVITSMIRSSALQSGCWKISAYRSVP